MNKSDQRPVEIEDSDLDAIAGGADAKREHDYVGNFNFKVEINGVTDVTVHSWDYAKMEKIEGKAK